MFSGIHVKTPKVPYVYTAKTVNTFRNYFDMYHMKTQLQILFLMLHIFEVLNLRI